MTISKDLVISLMHKVDQGIDQLLTTVTDQQNEIRKLKNENKLLKDNYEQVVKQIDKYVYELEEIKHAKK